MANNQPQATSSLVDEIRKLEEQLAEKTALLNKQQVQKIDLLVSSFLSEVEKNGFNKIEVKKLVVQKLTRKQKPRKWNFLFSWSEKGLLGPFLLVRRPTPQPIARRACLAAWCNQVETTYMRSMLTFFISHGLGEA